MREIATYGISYLDELAGSGGWYWAAADGPCDLSAAYEMHMGGIDLPASMIFVHHPDGKVISPFEAAHGQQFGAPVFCDGRICVLRADFGAGIMEILAHDPAVSKTHVLAALPLELAGSCVDLRLSTYPLTLTVRHGECCTRMLWPERRDICTRSGEELLLRDGERLYFSYRPSSRARRGTVVRSAMTGEVIERKDGQVMLMPDGQKWILG